MPNQCTKTTNLGDITIVEENNSIIELRISKTIFDNAEENETKLLKEAFKELFEYLDGKRKVFNLPLSPKGTIFQKRVWKELEKIPYGETVSYSEIAKRTGNEKAQRAVGMANNRNPIPIFIPCHRVIGKNGKLIGYESGIEIKQRLLEIEKE